MALSLLLLLLFVLFVEGEPDEEVFPIFDFGRGELIELKELILYCCSRKVVEEEGMGALLC